MVKLTLTYVNRTERVSARTNKPFTSLSLKAREYNDKFLSGFGNKENAHWKEGDVVEVASVTEVSKDGKIYLNFEMPKYGGNGTGAEVMKALERIENKLALLNLGVTELVAHKRKQTGEDVPKVAGTDIPYPEDEYQGQPTFDKPEDDGLDQLNPDEFQGM